MSLNVKLNKQKKYLKIIHREISNIYGFELCITIEGVSSCWGDNADRNYIINALVNNKKDIEFYLRKMDAFVKKALDYTYQMQKFEEYKRKNFMSDIKVSKIGQYSIAKKSTINIDTKQVISEANRIICYGKDIKESVGNIKKQIKKLDSQILELGGGKSQLNSWANAIEDNNCIDVANTMKTIANNYNEAEKKMKFIAELIKSDKYDLSKYGGVKGTEKLDKAYKRKQKKNNRDKFFNSIKDKTINPIRNYYDENVWYRIAWDGIEDVCNLASDTGSLFLDVKSFPKSLPDLFFDSYGLTNHLLALGSDGTAIMEVIKGNDKQAETYRNINDLNDFDTWGTGKERETYIDTLDDSAALYSAYKLSKDIKKKGANNLFLNFEWGEIKVTNEDIKKYHYSFNKKQLLEIYKNKRLLKNIKTMYSMVKSAVSGEYTANHQGNVNIIEDLTQPGAVIEKITSLPAGKTSHNPQQREPLPLANHSINFHSGALPLKK